MLDTVVDQDRYDTLDNWQIPIALRQPFLVIADTDRQLGGWPWPVQDCRSPRTFTPPPPFASNLRAHSALRTLALDDEYSVAFVPSLSQVAVLNHPALQLLRQLPLPQHRLDDEAALALLHLHSLGLLSDGNDDLVPPPESDILVAWLHITNACNLRCSYCYLNKTTESMSEATAYAAVDAVIRSAQTHGYRGIMLKYAGGEAALNMSLVAQTHTYALAQTNKYGLSLQAGILSNGTTLSPRKVELIQELGLKLMISLDGLSLSHDQQRSSVAGRPSAQATIRGIENARAAGITPDIAITVTGKSIAMLPELVSWLLERDLPFTINFYRANDCSTSFKDLQLDEQQLIEGLRAAYAVIEKQMPRWSLLDALLDRTDLSTPHKRTCAVGENYLVIDHHGRIAKCHMEINQPVTTINTSNPLALIRADQTGVQNVPVDRKEGCRTCEWRYWCAGGCAIATYRATGRYDVQSPNCNIYRALYPDVIRLEGKRILYWYQQQRMTW